MRKPLLRYLVLAVFFSVVATPVLAQQVTFEKVKVRFNKNANDRRLVDKDVDLILDDGARRLIVRSKERPLDVSYDDVEKVIFEVTTHMRGGVLGQIVGGVAGALISAKHVNDYWCYLEYRKANGEVEPYLLEIDKEHSPQVIAHMQEVFEDKVLIPEFAEIAEEIDKDLLPDVKSKHDMDSDKKNHPMPELRADKALVVVVCPAPAARNAGKGNQVKIHVNDRVEAVQKFGTYSFFYLDPGDYRLASQAGNASVLQITLEAGKDYYFFQNTFSGTWKSNTSLSRHSKELVMYELSGAYYSDWSRKR